VWFLDQSIEWDYYYKPNINTVMKLKVNLREDFASAKIAYCNQGNDYSYVANAVSVELWFEGKEANQDRFSPDGPARMFTWHNARVAWPGLGDTTW